MSISYSAELVVGVVFGQLTVEDKEYFKELLDDDIIEDFPPSYDAGYCGVVGIGVVSSQRYCFTEIVEADLADNIEVTKAEFKELTGMDGKLYITSKGT